MNAAQRKIAGRLGTFGFERLDLDPKRIDFFRAVARGGCFIADEVAYGYEVARVTRDGRRWTSRLVTFEAIEDDAYGVVAEAVCRSLRCHTNAPPGRWTHRLGDVTYRALELAALPPGSDFRAAGWRMLVSRYGAKRIARAFDRLDRKGLIEYGVAPVYGWPTERGRAALASSGFIPPKRARAV